MASRAHRAGKESTTDQIQQSPRLRAPKLRRTTPTRSTTIFPTPSLGPFHGSGRVNKHPSAESQHHGHASPPHKGQQRSDIPPPLRKPCDHTESSSWRALLSGRYRLQRQFLVWISLRYRGLHLGHRDHWQKTDENQEERSENPERADVCPNVYPGWMKDSPRRG